MDSLVTIFLNHIAEEIFVDNPLVQECVFRYRFNPEYKKSPHNRSDNSRSQKSIAELVEQEISGEVGVISEQVAAIIQKIYKIYQEEMQQDGITKEQLKGKRGGGGGRNAPWKIVFRWLWNLKYPRWSQDYIWDSWKNRAENSRDWIQFSDRTDGSKALVVPSPQPKETLPFNTPLDLAIDLDRPGSYILLFNRGQNKDTKEVSKYLFAPSQAFAPSYEIKSEVTMMPQQDSMMYQDGIKFNAEGKEEYLGILIDAPLDLPWLDPDPENPVLKWQGEHLNELWEKLHHQSNWQVFYRDFKVVA